MAGPTPMSLGDVQFQALGRGFRPGLRRLRPQRFFRQATCPAAWRAFRDVAARKLLAIDSATGIADLRVPPGNRLEALRGDRSGQWSIRINQQWRVCFVWGVNGPETVEIVDYH